MNLQRTLVAALLIAICLTGAIVDKTFIGLLRTTDGERLAERNGKVVLIRSRDGDSSQMDGLLNVWTISAPHLRGARATYLAMDQTEQDVKVYLADESGPSCKWVIEVLESYRPIVATRTKGAKLQGTSTSKFRLRVFDGRFKGWYLGANEPNEEQSWVPENEPLVLDLRVIKNQKQALTFDYVDTFYKVSDK